MSNKTKMNINKLLGQETPSKQMHTDDIRKYILESLAKPSDSRHVVRVTMMDQDAKRIKPSLEVDYLGLFSGYHLSGGKELVYIVPIDGGGDSIAPDEIYLRDIYSLEVMEQFAWLEVDSED